MFSVMSVCPPQVGCSHVTITLAALDITIQGPSWAPAPAPATSTLCVGTLDLYSFSVGKEAQNGTWRTWLLRTDFSENLCRAITFHHIYLRCNTPNYWKYEESNSTINFFFKCTFFFQMYQLQVGLYRRSNCLFWTPSHVQFLTVFFEYLGTGTGGHQRDGADFPAAVKLSQEKDGCQRRPYRFHVPSRPNPGPILFEFRAVLGKTVQNRLAPTFWC